MKNVTNNFVSEKKKSNVIKSKPKKDVLQLKLKSFGMMSQVYLFNMVLFLIAFFMLAIVINFYFSKQSKLYHMDYNYSVMKGIESLLNEQKDEFSDLILNSYIDDLWMSCSVEDPETGDLKYDFSKTYAVIKELFYEKDNSNYGCMAIYIDLLDQAYVYLNRFCIYSGKSELLGTLLEAYSDYHPHLIMTTETISNQQNKDRTYSRSRFHMLFKLWPSQK